MKKSQYSYLLDYSRQGDQPFVKAKIIEMALNGSGIRDTACVLMVSLNIVIATLKKSRDVIINGPFWPPTFFYALFAFFPFAMETT